MVKSEVQSHTWLNSEFKVNLGCFRGRGLVQGCGGGLETVSVPCANTFTHTLRVFTFFLIFILWSGLCTFSTGRGLKRAQILWNWNSGELQAAASGARAERGSFARATSAPDCKTTSSALC